MTKNYYKYYFWSVVIFMTAIFLTLTTIIPQSWAYDITKEKSFKKMIEALKDGYAGTAESAKKTARSVCVTACLRETDPKCAKKCKKVVGDAWKKHETSNDGGGGENTPPKPPTCPKAYPKLRDGVCQWWDKITESWTKQGITKPNKHRLDACRTMKGILFNLTGKCPGEAVPLFKIYENMSNKEKNLWRSGEAGIPDRLKPLLPPSYKTDAGTSDLEAGLNQIKNNTVKNDNNANNDANNNNTNNDANNDDDVKKGDSKLTLEDLKLNLDSVKMTLMGNEKYAGVLKRLDAIDAQINGTIKRDGERKEDGLVHKMGETSVANSLPFFIPRNLNILDLLILILVLIIIWIAFKSSTKKANKAIVVLRRIMNGRRDKNNKRIKELKESMTNISKKEFEESNKKIEDEEDFIKDIKGILDGK